MNSRSSASKQQHDEAQGYNFRTLLLDSTLTRKSREYCWLRPASAARRHLSFRERFRLRTLGGTLILVLPTWSTSLTHFCSSSSVVMKASRGLPVAGHVQAAADATLPLVRHPPDHPSPRNLRHEISFTSAADVKSEHYSTSKYLLSPSPAIT